MSILNPWAEARQLRDDLARANSRIHVLEVVCSELRAQLAETTVRDPKTGRFAARSKLS